MERMSGADALMLYLDRPRAYNHTIKMSILDASADPDGWSWPRFKRAFASRLVLVPRLRQRYLSVPFGLNHPVWVDDPSFNINRHLNRVACPAPGSMVELSELVGELYAKPLDHTRPLWEVWVIEGLEGGRVCVLLLIHHAISDGVGILRILDDFWNSQPGDMIYQTSTTWNPPPLPSKWRLFLDGLRDLPGIFREYLPGAIRGIAAGRRFRKEAKRAGTPPYPGPGSSGYSAPFACVLSANRSFVARSHSLAQFKSIGKALGATVNDVFLACVAGAVRRYLSAKDGVAPNQPMIATVPFSLVPLAERTRTGNFTTVDYTVLHTEIADPLERLKESGKSALAMKKHFEATREANIAALLNLLPPSVPKTADRVNEMKGGGVMPFWNIVISNVPGPKEILRLGPLKLAQWFSTGQIATGAVLNVTAWSYVDNFNICIMTDPEVVADPWQLMDGITASLEELANIVRNMPTDQTAGAAGRH